MLTCEPIGEQTPLFMKYQTTYSSKLGKIILVSNQNHLLELRLPTQKDALKTFSETFSIKNNLPIFQQTKKWLDQYFQGFKPDIQALPLLPIGGDFRQQVWKILCQIPYGQVLTYGDIAKTIAQKRKIKTMSAQAIGGAVGSNPIALIIPCHRVVGKNGSLTGFASGLNMKIQLLKHEGVDMSRFFIPEK